MILYPGLYCSDCCWDALKFILIPQVLEEASGRSTFRLIRLILFEIAVLHWVSQSLRVQDVFPLPSLYNILKYNNLSPQSLIDHFLMICVLIFLLPLKITPLGCVPVLLCSLMAEFRSQYLGL